MLFGYCTVGNWMGLGISLKWPLRELQFLKLPRCLHFSALEDATYSVIYFNNSLIGTKYQHQSKCHHTNDSA